ncbi:MAG: tRNA (adenosine(37)-N6)-threonylcarbamoyltransferase complex transferase subunit TsaD [Verrucomicrobiota bacterium]
MRVLGIETSCDETAVALVETNPWSTDILAQIISSQVGMHRPFGGVVPEVATREHLRNLPLLVPRVLKDINLSLQDVDAVAATEGPGLASSLLIGHSYARGLAVALSKPMIGVNHLEGHLFSPFIAGRRTVEFPFVGLIVSGGHTLLVHALGWDRYIKLGSTVDDAAGEAFDKVAKLLGLPYPGGPEIEKHALQGNPDAFGLPRSFPERDNLNFSFSGLKTAVRFFYEKSSQMQHDEAWTHDLCASFQKAVVDVLVRKAVQAVAHARCDRLTASGGVMCNKMLRDELEFACYEAGIELIVAEPALLHRQRGHDRRRGGVEAGRGHPPALRRGHQPEPRPIRPRARWGGCPRSRRRGQTQNRQTQEVAQVSDVAAPGEIEIW